MRQVIYYGPREIKLEERPLPVPGAGEVVVKLGAALTCGTDFKAYRQGHPVLLGAYPSPFGHELAGTVSAVGAGVKNVKEGDRVVVANSAPMDDCFWCTHGQNHLCPNLKLHNGAYAEYDLVPAHIVKHNLHPLKNSVPFEVGALAEPFSTTIHAAEIMAVTAGDSAAVRIMFSKRSESPKRISWRWISSATAAKSACSAAAPRARRSPSTCTVSTTSRSPFTECSTTRRAISRKPSGSSPRARSKPTC